MKNIKKIIAVLLSMTAIASTSVMAADEATYKDGTASLTTTLNAAEGDQLTVVIVPKDAESITSGNIYYINQGAFEEEFTNILKAMKVKDGYEKDYEEYEVRIGGVKEDGSYTVKKFYFEKATAEEVIEYGNVDGDYADDGVTPVISVNDAVYVLKYVVDNTVQFPNAKGQEAAVKAANVDGDYEDDGVTPIISVNDAVYILKHVVDSSVEFPAAKAE